MDIMTLVDFRRWPGMAAGCPFMFVKVVQEIRALELTRVAGDC